MVLIFSFFVSYYRVKFFEISRRKLKLCYNIIFFFQKGGSLGFDFVGGQKYELGVLAQNKGGVKIIYLF